MVTTYSILVARLPKSCNQAPRCQNEPRGARPKTTCKHLASTPLPVAVPILFSNRSYHMPLVYMAGNANRPNLLLVHPSSTSCTNHIFVVGQSAGSKNIKGTIDEAWMESFMYHHKLEVGQLFRLIGLPNVTFLIVGVVEIHFRPIMSIPTLAIYPSLKVQ